MSVRYQVHQSQAAILAVGHPGWLGLILMWSVILVCGQSDPSYEKRLADLQQQWRMNPTNTALLLAMGDLCHDEGVNDNPAAVKLAESYLLQLLALQPDHAKGRALYGSTLTMKGRDAFWPHLQLSWVHKGNQEMDAAVKLAPDDPQVRMVRAINNVHMPAFLGRTDVVRGDFAWLWQQVTNQSTSLSADFKQTVALHQGRLLARQKQTDHARQVWQQGILFAPQSALAQEIRSELAASKRKTD